MTNKNLIFVHGMGEGGYAESYSKLYSLIAKMYNESKYNKIFCNEFNKCYVNWSTNSDKKQLNIFNRVFPDVGYFENPLGNNFFDLFSVITNIGTRLRNFVHFYMGDVIAYTTKNDNNIRLSLMLELVKYCDKPFSIIAHSLGSVILNDILLHTKLWVANSSNLQRGLSLDDFDFYKRKIFKSINFDEFAHNIQKYLQNFITIGSPIGLFLQQDLEKFGSLNYGFAESPIDTTKKQCWYNFYNLKDFFSYPVEPFFINTRIPSIQNIKDIKVENFLSLTAHGNYWDNRHVARTIAEIL